MPESNETLVLVGKGHVIETGKEIIPPGDTFLCREEDLPRLLKLGVVSIVEEAVESQPRLDMLVTAIGELDPNQENDENWTKSGKPQVSALEALLGVTDISAAERDEAYDLYLSQQEGQA